VTCYTVYDLLRGNLERDPSAVALLLGDERLSYEQLDARAGALAGWLLESGVRRGARVGIHLRKSFAEVVATFAAARIGAVFVNINHQWTGAQLDYVVGDCGIDVLITDSRRAAQVAGSATIERLRCVLVDGRAPAHEKLVEWRSIADWAPPAQQPCIDLDLAALMYTSGSTGRPKGVMLTHRNIVSGAQIVSGYLGNTAADRTLGLLPMSFDYGMSQVTTMFLVGGSVALQPVMMPAEIASTAASLEVTGIPLVPPAWVQLVTYLQESPRALPSLRYVTNTGGKIPGDVLRAMPEVFPGVDIVLMYGLTEAFRSTYLPPSLFPGKMGAIGRAIPNNEIYVVDAERGLCGPGEEGELVHRGCLISNGYWGQPEATAEKIRVNEHLRALIGDEKVLHSGDTVRIDDDGILWFVGRRDSLIKTSGFRLSPTEVEEFLCESPLVGQAVAFGVEDHDLGEAVHAILVPADPRSLDLEEVRAHCHRVMPGYMIPKSMRWWSGAPPLTASGKLDRQVMMREMADVPEATST